MSHVCGLGEGPGNRTYTTAKVRKCATHNRQVRKRREKKSGRKLEERKVKRERIKEKIERKWKKGKGKKEEKEIN